MMMRTRPSLAWLCTLAIVLQQSMAAHGHTLNDVAQEQFPLEGGPIVLQDGDFWSVIEISSDDQLATLQINCSVFGTVETWLIVAPAERPPSLPESVAVEISKTEVQFAVRTLWEGEYSYAIDLLDPDNISTRRHPLLLELLAGSSLPDVLTFRWPNGKVLSRFSGKAILPFRGVLSGACRL